MININKIEDILDNKLLKEEIEKIFLSQKLFKKIHDINNINNKWYRKIFFMFKIYFKDRKFNKQMKCMTKKYYDKV